jgi:Secretion system C-terminal sorting domain
MKQFVLFISMVLFACTALAQDPAYPASPPAPQNIIKAEYFFDADPGFGNGTDIPVTAATTINNLVASVNTTGLSNGIHRLFIRTRNNEGSWSMVTSSDFLVDFDPLYPTAPAAPQNIIRAEYFFDTDPGIGNGTAISITPAADINNLVASITTTGLTNGIHRLYIRTRNNEGAWAITSSRDFLVDTDPVYPAPPAAPQNITQAEYFLNTDPGIGSGTAISITPAVDINNLVAGINTTGLSSGIYRLYIRTRNNEGAWAITNSRDFLVDIDPAYPTPPASPQNITQAEYFLNTDPGIGNGTAISITPAVDINNLVASINSSALTPGTTNRLYLRTRNNEGNWSITNIATFVVDIVSDPVYPTPPPAPQNIVQAEYFLNTDPGIGNGTAISITAAVDINNLVTGINTSALTPGTTNLLYLRTRNNEGSWSITNIATFTVDIVNDPAYPPAPPAPGNITYAEYFFDTDPGFGNGNAIAITPGVNISNLVIAANTSALAPGTHRLFVRSFDDWSITSVQSFNILSALPLRFLSFTAAGSNNDVLLNWDTDNEINTSHFDVEFSTDGSRFTKIAEVKAMNTVGTHQYRFVHVSPAGLALYYRIKQVDLDGKFDYSSIARVNRSLNNSITLTPNPAQNFAMLMFGKPSAKTNLRMVNTNGQVVLQQQINEGTRQHTIDISKLPAGVYIVQLQTTNGIETFKLVKQ